MIKEKKYHISPIKPEDDKILASVIRNCLAEYKANKPGTVFFDSTTDYLSEVFKTRRSAYFVLHEDEEVRGGAGIFPTSGLPEDTCELVKMYISPAARKKGYANMLLKLCTDKAKELGYKTMYLETLSELTDAIPFYKKSGFTRIDEPMGNSGHTGCDVWMKKHI